MHELRPLYCSSFTRLAIQQVFNVKRQLVVETTFLSEGESNPRPCHPEIDLLNLYLFILLFICLHLDDKVSYCRQLNQQSYHFWLGLAQTLNG